MKEFIGEFIGTAILITLGCGVVAGVLLNKSKAQNSGWLVICLGWGLAVMIAIYTVGSLSGAHLNPAVSIALVVIGKLDIVLLPNYILGQFLGAFVGATIVYLQYLPHWRETEDQAAKLAVFSTSPAIRNTLANFMSEFIGGPYSLPPYRIGDTLVDVRRGEIAVTGRHPCPAGQWPTGTDYPTATRAGLILCGSLIDAVRTESVAAICHHWGVSRWTVRRWRAALGVGRYTPGTTALQSETVGEHFSNIDRANGGLAKALMSRKPPT